MQAENRQNKETLSAFAHRLGVLAGRKRLKQVAIAKHLTTPGNKVSPQRVGSWFQGRNFPGGDVEIALADLLGVSRDWLIEGKETSESKDSFALESETSSVGEAAATYGTADTLRQEIRRRFEETMRLAGDDVGRLGWFREQMIRHGSAPEHWDIHAQIAAEVDEEHRLEMEAAEREQQAHSQTSRKHA